MRIKTEIVVFQWIAILFSTIKDRSLSLFSDDNNKHPQSKQVILLRNTSDYLNTNEGIISASLANAQYKKHTFKVILCVHAYALFHLERENPK